LDVDVLGSEEAFGSIAGQIFDDVGELAAAIVALAGIAFRILVGEDGANCFKHGARDKVLGGDHLEAFVLADDFVFDLRGDFRIGGGESSGKVNRHRPLFYASESYGLSKMRIRFGRVRKSKGTSVANGVRK